MAPCLLVVLDRPVLWHLGAARGPSTPSLDDLIAAGEDRRRHVNAKRLSGLEVERRLVPRRRLHREVGRFLALEDAIDVAGCAAVRVDRTALLLCRRLLVVESLLENAVRDVSQKHDDGDGQSNQRRPKLGERDRREQRQQQDRGDRQHSHDVLILAQ